MCGNLVKATMRHLWQLDFLAAFCPSVRLSITPSLRSFIGRSVTLTFSAFSALRGLGSQCSCQSALFTLNTAPAHPHVTGGMESRASGLVFYHFILHNDHFHSVSKSVYKWPLCQVRIGFRGQIAI